MNGNAGDQTACHCHYHERLIVVRRGNEGGAIDVLDANGIPAAEIDSGQFHTYIDGLTDDELGAVVEMIALLDVDDPHASADLLFNSGIEASPVHGLGFLGHSMYKGDDFKTDETVHPNVENATSELVIAVVDSGLAPAEDLPAWMSDQAGVQCDRPQDTEVLAFRNPISHGTFVVSLIRRLAPDHVVSIASARPDPGYLITDEEPHTPSEALPTDELNVFGALIRLVNRHSGGHVVALNLSLGAHECPGGGDFLMTVKIALEHWTSKFPETAIFAAGGNSTCVEPLYPAAWGSINNVPIHAVGAAADGGHQLVWVKGSPESDPGRDWITDWAPGNELQGLSGQGIPPDKTDDHVVKWSGSSFACAFATASLAAGGTSTPDANGQTWWPDQNMDYDSIQDLRF